jgi:ABC-type multidrug transport system fused ATPase/permease subunit
MPSQRTWQFLGALSASALTFAAAWRGWWPFDASPPPTQHFAHPTIWQYLFSDRKVLGFARLIVFVLAIYLVASVPALVIGRRWMRAFGTAGIRADERERDAVIRDFRTEAGELTEKLDEATKEIDRLRSERDQARTELRRIIKAAQDALTQTKTGPG